MHRFFLTFMCFWPRVKFNINAPPWCFVKNLAQISQILHLVHYYPHINITGKIKRKPQPSAGSRRQQQEPASSVLREFVTTTDGKQISLAPLWRSVVLKLIYRYQTDGTGGLTLTRALSSGSPVCQLRSLHFQYRLVLLDFNVKQNFIINTAP